MRMGKRKHRLATRTPQWHARKYRRISLVWLFYYGSTVLQVEVDLCAISIEMALIPPWSSGINLFSLPVRQLKRRKEVLVEILWESQHSDYMILEKLGSPRGV